MLSPREQDFLDSVSVVLRDAVGRMTGEIATLKAEIEMLKAKEPVAWVCPDDVAAMIKAALAELPVPKDGLDGKDGRDGAEGPPGAAGAAGRDGIDGQPGQDGAPGERGPEGVAGVAGRDGQDGAKGSPGEPGKDGIDGRDGRDGLPGVPGATGEKGKDGLNGKDGRDGVDGKDGFSVEDVEFASIDERTIELRFFRNGEFVKAHRHKLGGFADKAVWKPGVEYEKGDGVTWGGSFWIAQIDTPAEKPGDGKEWRLAVKRGQDGKDGRPGKDGDRGPAGPKGRDLTTLMPDGSRFP